MAIAGLSRYVSEVAGRLLAHPSRQLTVTAVTGTNGKTSVAWWVAQLDRQLGHSAAVIGTLGSGRVDGRGFATGALDTGMTTPDAVAVQQQLRSFVDAGISHVAMEVSSHALDQHRVAALQIDTAVFTNLSRDHLDYHGDMQRYGEAKRRLFEHPGLRHAVINIDDAFGRDEIVGALAPGVEQITYSLSANSGATLCARGLRLGEAGLQMHVATPDGEMQVHSSAWGRFNAANLLAVIGQALAAGHNTESIAREMAQLSQVPGRLQSIESGLGDEVKVRVDYAHTPDAVAKSIAAAREHHAGTIVALVGCGGDRDRGKRPLMAAAAEQVADRLLLTSDNPRTEEPGAIIDDMLAGLRDPDSARVIVDRAEAIDRAITEAAPGDLVLILGKGHESYQVIGDRRRPFSDVAEAERALRRRAAAGNDPRGGGA